MFFPRVEAPVTCVLEVGAHHGFYSVAAAYEYPQAQIIAVEPSPESCVLIRRNVDLNNLADRVDVVEYALAAAEGDATLRHDRSGSWGSSLFPLDGEVSTETVRTRSLAQMLAGRSPELVKSNAEGGEFELVRQLEELGLRPSVLVLMVHDEFGDVDAMRSSLTALGYTIEVGENTAHPVWHCRL